MGESGSRRGMSLWTGRDGGVSQPCPRTPIFDHERVRGTSRKRDRLLAMTSNQIVAFGALLIVALGVMTFVELADDMTEADGRAFDQAVLGALRPTAGADPWGPGWLETAALDLTALGGTAVLSLFAVIVTGFLVLQR